MMIMRGGARVVVDLRWRDAAEASGREFQLPSRSLRKKAIASDRPRGQAFAMARPACKKKKVSWPNGDSERGIASSFMLGRCHATDTPFKPALEK
jgi:hypothetical protein